MLLYLDVCHGTQHRRICVVHDGGHAQGVLDLEGQLHPRGCLHRQHLAPGQGQAGSEAETEEADWQANG